MVERRVFGDCEQIAYNAETADAKRRNAQGILNVRAVRSNVGFFYTLFGRRTANIGEGESVFTPARAQGASVRQLHADARGRDSCRRNRRDADDRPGTARAHV